MDAIFAAHHSRDCKFIGNENNRNMRKFVVGINEIRMEYNIRIIMTNGIEGIGLLLKRLINEVI